MLVARSRSRCGGAGELCTCGTPRSGDGVRAAAQPRIRRTLGPLVGMLRPCAQLALLARAAPNEG
eukprot:9596721-Alexandrium_andersonii.AAC.1